jgi:hypothetical protein
MSGNAAGLFLTTDSRHLLLSAVRSHNYLQEQSS